MDSHCKFIDLNTPLINLIKCLLVATSFILAAPVFADANQVSACYIAIDYDTAFHTCTKAAEQGEAKAQYKLGFMYGNGQGTPQDYKQALYWYTKAAEQGNSDAQSQLGDMFYLGQGTLKDSVVAYAWYNVASAQGNESATKNRGIIEEKMTPKQIAEAQKLSKEYYAKYVK